ncbi:hypothetical protein [Cohnella lupini]|uniref:Ig-like domain-containing protein n=1 Tax=Cohnella lupini TaxID=1294267 RepID=A0A3D9I4R0_9BACL|nr:hypothetical protein [Cohnella lupini]RED56738.1 hypothetical protein DFP95_11228 [Cohnella lupini]
MAVHRPKPLLGDTNKSRIIREKISARACKVGVNNPTFPRLTVIWVQNNGVPFDTTGFFARLTRGTTIVSTASFDRFGVVRFNNVRTLTNVSYNLRVFTANGILFRTRFIPAGVETFAIIG